MKKGITSCCALIFSAIICICTGIAFAQNDYTVNNIIATETNPKDKMTAFVENVRVEQYAGTLMSEDSAENIVTVTFDVTNTSSSAHEFSVYAAAYKQEGTLYSANIEKRILQSGEKRQLIFKVRVPNDGKNTYGKIFVWDSNMQPASEYTPFTVVNENPEMLPDIEFKEDTILYTDMYYNNVTLSSGKIDLNGHTLYIQGDLLQSGGEMYINNGSLIIDGDYRIQTQSESTDRYGDTEIIYDASDGILNMTNENDKVLVNGDFCTQSSYDHSQYLQNGILEVKGDFGQYYSSQYYLSDSNFNSSNNHKVIFSGKEQQSIYFDYPSYSGFADVEFKNTNINIKSELRGWILKRDTVIDNDVNYGIGITHTINGDNGLDLHGYKFEIKGSYLQTGGTMYINGGSLVIGKDYRIQTITESTDQYGTTTQSYTGSYGILNMTNENDKVLVKGSFYICSSYSHSSYLTNGVLEIKGDFEQGCYYYETNYNNFDASGNHKVILSGTGVQNVSFDSEYSQFNILILTKPYETGYTFSRTPCWNTLYQADAVSINYGGQTGTYAPTGNYSREFTDMTMLSAAGDMPIKRTYNSQDEESSVFNQGWTLSISARLTDEGNGYKQIKLPDGSTNTFKETDGVYEAVNSRNTLTKNEDGTYTLSSKSQVKYQFSSDGRITAMQDRYGNTTSFETASDGSVAALTEPSGKRYSFSYVDGKLTKITDISAGAEVLYEYDGGRLSKVTNPAGVNVYYEYDGNGRLSKILDHDRNIVEQIAYNADNKVDYVIDADGNKSVYSYDLAGGKTTITDSNGRQKIQWYDSTFNVTKNQDAEGGITATEYNMTYGMNKYNEPRAVTDRNGRNTYYERDERGNVIKQSNTDGSYKSYIYDENNNIISERDENGNYTYYIYDDTKTKLLKQAKPLDGVTQYSELESQELFAVTEYTYYDDHKIKGLVKSKREPEGLVSEFSYDDNGMLSSVIVTDAKDGTVGTTQYHYNNKGLLEYEISPDGYKTSYEYDGAGNLKSISANNGKSVSVIQYDSAGRKIKEISPNEYAQSGLNATGKTYSYYPSGRVKSETDALGNTVVYIYDLYGNVQTQTNADGSAYKYEYDGINRKTKAYFRDKDSSDFVLTNEYSYNVNSAKNSETSETVYLSDNQAVATVNELDYGERLIRQTRADGTEITKSYDGKGNIKSETDADGNVKSYAYNALGQLIQEKIPFDGNYQYKKYSYDKAGNCIKQEITNQASGDAEEYSVTEYGYNSRGMLVSTAAYDNGELKSAAQFVYDNAGNKVRVYTGLSSLLTINGIDDVTESGDSDYAVRKYEYDYSGKVTKAVDAMGAEEIYLYDNNGNLVSYTDRKGNTAVYEYDVMNRLTSKALGGSSYSYSYDSVGNKTAVSGDYNALYNYDGKGNILSEESGKAKKTYSYDLQSNRTGFVLTYGAEEKLGLNYIYDSMGRVSQVLNESEVLAEYGYDNNGNLASTVYNNGNSTDYSYNCANLVTKVSNKSADEVISAFDYTYYMDGRQRSKSDGVNSENYTYDDLGRLTAVDDTVYAYDDYNNRIRMNDILYLYDKNGRLQDNNYSYDNNGNVLTDGNNTYTYDVWNRLISANDESYEYDDLTGRIGIGDTDVISDGINVVYTSDGVTYLNGINSIAYEVGGERVYYLFNGHGDVVNLTDASGTAIKSYKYDVFGNEANKSDDDINPIRYAGQYYDITSGNYYMNNRYYNAETGRFLSQDSFYGNDSDILSLNQYTYCYNDPIQYVDLSGNSVISTAKSIALNSLQSAAKSELKSYLKDQYSSAIGIEIADKNYLGDFAEKVGKNITKGASKKAASKLGISTEYSVFAPIIESGINNVIEEFNSSQKENRDFSMGNVVGETATGVVLSYVKSAPGVGTVYDMCLDLSNGDIFKNITVKTFTKAVDTVADSMGYEPINWNAGKDLYKTDGKQFSGDYNSFKSKGWSSNTSYWYAMTQSLSRKVQSGNSWLKKYGYIK